MLKFFHLSAALAAILSSQIPNNLLAMQADAVNQSLQKSTFSVVNETSNASFVLADPAIFAADSSTNTPDGAEKVNTGMILGIAAIGGAVVFLNAKKAKNSFQSTATLGYKTRDSIAFDQASRQLRKNLLSLLHDDRNTANRLVSQVKSNNPTRSINWCVEKVIYDLERDRGRY